MAQASDNTVDNGTGAAVRSDINARLAALFSNHSGATDTAMVTKYPYQTWADTTASQLKLRNSGNTAWIPLRGLDGSVVLPDGTQAAPSITFGSDGTDQGFYRVEGQISGSVGIAYVTQLGGSNTTLFTVGKNESVVDNDGPSLYWNYQGNPTDTSNTTNEGLIIQQRGRIRIAMRDSDCLRLNRIGSGGEQLGSVVEFQSNGVQAGRVGILTSTTVDLIDASDRRLKDNITDMPEAKSRINQIQLHRFRMTSSGVYEEGFIAQELKDVYPNAVMGNENDVDENGDLVYMGVGKATLVPLLMKGLQEAYAEIAALTARIDALEAA
jgi:hypothetical protein